MTRTIWTIGHSTHPLNHLLEMLKQNNIGTLVDIRSLPGSRKFPHFNKESLQQTVPAAHIEYTHILDLGGRRRSTKDSYENSPNKSWRHKAFRSYADHMETPQFLRGVDRLEEIAGQTNVCYMCSEAYWLKCHRSMLSDFLLSKEWMVKHITRISKNGTDSTTPHKYTQPARIFKGKLTYHPENLFAS
jgi:uncharacterized protein (DUF488 family)